MASKRTRGDGKSGPRQPAPYVLDGLAEAQRLSQKRDYAAAARILRDLDRGENTHPAVLEALYNVYLKLDDMTHLQEVTERLVRLQPDDPTLVLALLGSYVTNLHPVLALGAARRFVERWPDHEEAAEVRQTIAAIEQGLPDLLAEVGLPADGPIERLEQHERIQAYLAEGHFTQAQRAAEALLRQAPGFVPALNNLSLACIGNGEAALAIQAAQRVLASEPDNIHALANLIRFLVLSGRADEARAVYAPQLLASTRRAHIPWVKKAEAFTYLGDDATVLQIVEQAERLTEAGPVEDALLYHLAAVAALNLDREADARRYWQRSLKSDPDFTLARDNQDDLRRGVGERQGPWPFELIGWVSPVVLADLLKRIGPAIERERPEQASREVRRFYRQHPELAHVVPSLLLRGDPSGRELALSLAHDVQAPELLAALRDFAFGRRGPDNLRQRAAEIVSRAGLLAPGEPVDLWVKGARRRVWLLSYEIYDEPEHKHDPRVEKLMTEAWSALRAGQGAAAQPLLEQALALEPGRPDILNNLAVAFDIQGQWAQAEALVREIHAQHPDYVFARLTVARMYAREGQLEQALETIRPVLTQTRLHTSEFTQLAGTQIELLLAEDNPDGARQWLALWREVDPDDRQLKLAQAQIARHASPLGRLLGGRKRKQPR